MAIDASIVNKNQLEPACVGVGLHKLHRIHRAGADLEHVPCIHQSGHGNQSGRSKFNGGFGVAGENALRNYTQLRAVWRRPGVLFESQWCRLQ